MADLFENDPITQDQYGTSENGSSGNYLARWKVYDELTAPAVDFYVESGRALNIGPGDRLLDIGCGNGDGIIRLHETVEPAAEYVGLDISETVYFAGEEKIRRERLPGITFQMGKMQDLIGIFQPGSFDKGLSMFSLYHVPVPRFGLLQMGEAVAPDGRIAVATIDQGNKPRMREFQRLAMKLCGVDPSKAVILPSSFDTTEAKATLPDFFEKVEVAVSQDAITCIETEDDLKIYLGALATYRTACAAAVPPLGTEWTKVVYNDIRRIIEEEIEQSEDGKFIDLAKRTGFICTRPKQVNKRLFRYV